MPPPGPEALRLAERYGIAVPERLSRGTGGELLGRGTGSSLEFQDRRDYVSGDDLRHLDWGAYARTDQLMVRLYREEIQPRVEVLVDASRSMGTSDQKLRLGVDIAALLVRSAMASNMPVRIVTLGDTPGELAPEAFLDRGIEAEGRLPLGESLRQAVPLLRPGCLRYLVSDVLSPGDPVEVVKALASRAGSLAISQVLSPDDADPEPGCVLRLTDAETDEVLDLVLDDAALSRYRTRLARLEATLATETRRHGGAFARCVAGPELEEVCRASLVPARLLVPR